jgi:hypothetical protein
MLSQRARCLGVADRGQCGEEIALDERRPTNNTGSRAGSFEARE